MIFTSDQIDRMTEQDIREEIIAKIVDRLGYQFGSPHYVERERTLKYPYTQIGRKGKNDIPIGAPDYICGVDGRRGTFTIEAKRGNRTLSEEDARQAHSYAAHWEIGAKFYVLTNGHVLQIYETHTAAESHPIVEISNTDFDKEFYRIENILSPENLIKYCNQKYETGKPMSENIGSKCEIKNGWIISEKIIFELDSPETNHFSEFIKNTAEYGQIESTLIDLTGKKQPVVDGTVFRDLHGRITASLELDSFVPENSINLDAIGLKKIVVLTDSEFISESSESPTLFQTTLDREVAEGTELYSPFSRTMEKTAGKQDISMLINAAGYLGGEKFKGEFYSSSIMRTSFPGFQLPDMILEQVGTFELWLKNI